MTTDNNDHMAGRVAGDPGESASGHRPTVAPTAPESPCIGICQVDSHQICQGCFRNLSEIGRWRVASADEKHSILSRVRSRKTARG